MPRHKTQKEPKAAAAAAAAASTAVDWFSSFIAREYEIEMEREKSRKEEETGRQSRRI